MKNILIRLMARIFVDKTTYDRGMYGVVTVTKTNRITRVFIDKQK